jgi:hypothetical protein
VTFLPQNRSNAGRLRLHVILIVAPSIASREVITLSIRPKFQRLVGGQEVVALQRLSIVS